MQRVRGVVYLPNRLNSLNVGLPTINTGKFTNERRRRGRGKGRISTTGIKVFYNNINGYNSKKQSLEQIMKAVNPDIIVLCETKRGGCLKKDELEQYKVIPKNTKPGKEGLLVGVRKESFKSVREITETELTNIITVRIEYPKMNLRVIVAHAPQETDKDEERSEFFEEMEVQIERAEDSGDELLVVGDFNARLSCTAGNIVAENGSPNGMKLAELTKKYDMDICNFHENTWGRWT